TGACETEEVEREGFGNPSHVIPFHSLTFSFSLSLAILLCLSSLSHLSHPCLSHPLRSLSHYRSLSLSLLSLTFLSCTLPIIYRSGTPSLPPLLPPLAVLSCPSSQEA